MNKRIVILISILLLSTLSAAQQADDLIGKYRLPNHLDVEIFKVGESYFGKIIGLGDIDVKHQKDINNPDKARRDEPLIGKVIINDLKFDESHHQWVDGSMYGPEKGLVFSLKVTEIRESEIEVVGSKYFFWKTLTWEKL